MVDLLRRSLKNPFANFGSWFGGAPTARVVNGAVVVLTQELANVSASAGKPRNFGAVRRAIEMLANDLATVPLVVVRRDGTELTDHPAIDLLTGESNGVPVQLLRAWAIGKALDAGGNSYLGIERDSRGVPRGLLPLDAASVEVGYVAGTGLVYRVAGELVDAGDLLHFRGGLDTEQPWLGRSPLDSPSQVLMAAAVAEVALAIMAGTGMVGKIIAKHPGTLSDPASLGDAWAARHSLPENVGKPVFAGEGITPDVAAADGPARTMEAIRLGRAEVGVMFGIPAQLLAEGAGRGSAEVGQEYANFGVRPRAELIAAEMSAKLLAPGERFRHELYPLTIGDFITAGRAYPSLVQVGALASDDVRKRMGLRQLGGEYAVPKPIISGVTPQEQPAKEGAADAD